MSPFKKEVNIKNEVSEKEKDNLYIDYLETIQDPNNFDKDYMFKVFRS